MMDFKGKSTPQIYSSVLCNPIRLNTVLWLILHLWDMQQLPVLIHLRGARMDRHLLLTQDDITVARARVSTNRGSPIFSFSHVTFASWAPRWIKMAGFWCLSHISLTQRWPEYRVSISWATCNVLLLRTSLSWLPPNTSIGKCLWNF